MAGAMHRMGVYLGLIEDEDYVDDGYSAYPPERGSSRHPSGSAHVDHGEYAEVRHTRGGARGGVVAQLEEREYRGPREHRDRGDRGDLDDYTNSVEQYANRQLEQPTYQITALHPRTYNEARTIGEHFRKATPVIMNLSEMDDADAKRLVDFAAGLTFGLHGRIERVTAKVFLLSPHNVTVTAQDKARMAENGFFNQS
jgi:cell division inhibitor SepF